MHLHEVYGMEMAMRARFRIGWLLLASLGLGGCALGARLGWHSQRELPSEAVRLNCENTVKALQGQPDHELALRACIDAQLHRHAATDSRRR